MRVVHCACADDVLMTWQDLFGELAASPAATCAGSGRLFGRRPLPPLVIEPYMMTYLVDGKISRALEALYVFTCVDSFGGFRDALSALIEGDTGGARHAIESGLGGSHAAALMTCRLPVDCILSVC